ncbi:hypothetical protein TNCT_379011 [Trichonephila clavata]|uniref:Uncharacterized protein n=1 Tax=Trichonephila clavata TaxID=2740835 RepID=A0A8X6KYN0_TRICU|nr:hypothetical protein TNCT_379011 [Trichonephila clavata]
MAAIDVDASFRSLEDCFESLENVLNCVGNPSKKLREGARTALGCNLNFDCGLFTTLGKKFIHDTDTSNGGTGNVLS